MNPEYSSTNGCHLHPDKEAIDQCSICKAECCEECIHEGTGICRNCLFKGAVLIVVLMIIISYTAWLGLLL